MNIPGSDYSLFAFSPPHVLFLSPANGFGNWYQIGFRFQSQFLLFTRSASAGWKCDRPIGIIIHLRNSGRFIPRAVWLTVCQTEAEVDLCPFVHCYLVFWYRQSITKFEFNLHFTIFIASHHFSFNGINCVLRSVIKGLIIIWLVIQLGNNFYW